MIQLRLDLKMKNKRTEGADFEGLYIYISD